MNKLTPLHSIAFGLNAGFVDINGWKTADVYTDMNEEIKTAERRVGLIDMSSATRITVEGPDAAGLLKSGLKTPKLEINGGHFAKDGTAVYKLRADRFLVHAASEAGQALLQALTKAKGSATVTEITHGTAEIRLIGPDSDDLLSTACALDLHPTHFPNGVVKQSSVAKTAQTIIRQDIGGLLSYALIGPRSFGVYLWETLMTAGARYNCQPVGLAAFNQISNR